MKGIIIMMKILRDAVKQEAADFLDKACKDVQNLINQVYLDQRPQLNKHSSTDITNLYESLKKIKMNIRALSSLIILGKHTRVQIWLNEEQESSEEDRHEDEKNSEISNKSEREREIEKVYRGYSGIPEIIQETDEDLRKLKKNYPGLSADISQITRSFYWGKLVAMHIFSHRKWYEDALIEAERQAKEDKYNYKSFAGKL